jgi:hypothetical protein
MQVYDTASTNTLKNDNSFVYENDSVRITYTFWQNGGAMSFSVYNKLDVPLYIDWRKSSCIINSKNHFYAQDSIISEAAALSSYSYYNRYLYSTGSKITTAHPKYIGFIPPKSAEDRCSSIIVKGYATLPSTSDYQIQLKNGSSHKKTKIYEQKYDDRTSPLDFRNYLTLSYDEDFHKNFTIDNNFYISRIRAMDIYNFMFQFPDGSIKYFYKNPTGFYLFI